MPNMADITVKASNGTTDVIYVKQAPSSGDGTPAIWRVDAANVRAGFRPIVNMRSQWNGPRTARKVIVDAKFPVVESIGGVDTITGTIPLQTTGTFPQNVSDAAIKEAVYQHGNLLVSQLFRDSMVTGFAPS